MTVGTGRNRNDIAKALLFSIQQHQPDKTIFLCSSKTAAETLPLLDETLRQANGQYEAKTLPDENDVQALYGHYLGILRTLGQPAEIIADFTSGTKAMSAALFAAAVAVQAGKVSYIIGPRDATGRVTESTGVEAFYPARIYARRQLERAMDLFNHYEFAAARQLAKEYKRNKDIDDALRLLADDLYGLADAFDKWERFCWQPAASGLGKAAKAKSELKGMLDCKQIKEASCFCDTVQKNSWSLERLYDLAANAERRFKQGRFDDALSRLYRAFEYMVQVRLKKQYRIETGKVRKEDLRQLNLPEEFIQKQRFYARKKEQIPVAKVALRDAMEILCRIDEVWGAQLRPLYFGTGSYEHPNGSLNILLDKRNRSWLAHGTTPAKKTDVKDLLDELFRLLDKFLSSEQSEQFRRATQFPKLQNTNSEKM
jgi:CRISPR-associated protein (TIGR02710 family)